MLFSSIIFIIYFLPIVIAGYYILKFSRAAQNVWLLLASLVFYAWGEPSFIFILIFSILINYFMLLIIDKARETRQRALALTVLTCAFNLIVLLACKQFSQIIRGVSHLLTPTSDIIPDIAVPIGISFFTLRTVAYAIDVYKGAAKPPKNPIDAALHLSFFPTVIAGPLMHYSDMSEQILHRRESWQGFSSGVCRFITGLAKKVLIANSMKTISDYVFSYSAMSNEVTQVPALMAWLGAIAFTLQIFFDLSGYSDMAIGLARMFGFEFDENFDYPYASLSMNEFWGKWNITLTGWFQEYIYSPLGGALVKNNDKMVRNIFIMWLFVGVWHGAKWTFILWGLWQAFFLVFERAINYERRGFSKPVRRIYVAIVILFGFVIFNTGDIYQVTLYFSNMLGLNHNGFINDTVIMFIKEYALFFAAGILFSTPVARKIACMVNDSRTGKLKTALSAVYPVLMIAVFCMAMAYIIRGSSHSFIYFRF